MIVNFKGCKISRGAYKLARTPTLLKKKELIITNSKECSLTGQVLGLLFRGYQKLARTPTLLKKMS
jgi:hypothetical protein